MFHGKVGKKRSKITKDGETLRIGWEYEESLGNLVGHRNINIPMTSPTMLMNQTYKYGDVEFYWDMNVMGILWRYIDHGYKGFKQVDEMRCLVNATGGPRHPSFLIGS